MSIDETSEEREFSYEEDLANEYEPGGSGCLRRLAISLLVGVIGLAMCGGGALALLYFATSQLADSVQNKLGSHPVVTEHLGKIQSMDANLVATLNEPGNDVLVFELIGEKARGRLTVEVVAKSGNLEKIAWARLKLTDGDEIDLKIPETK